MKFKLRIGIALVLILSAQSAFATELSMDIHEAVDLTLKQNTMLRSLKQEINKAKAFKLHADGTLLPSLSASAHIARQKEEIMTKDNSKLNENRAATGTLEQVLYSGGKNSALRRQSSQKKTIADMMIATGENGAIGELFGRFYNVLLQKKYIEAEKSAVKTSELHLRQVKKMSELGLSNKLEVIRAGQQLATNSANLSRAKGNHEAAQIALMNYMAIEPKNGRAISGDFSAQTVIGDRDKSLLFATEYRADRKQLQEQLKYQENQLFVEKSGLMPKLTLAGVGGWNHPNSREDVTGSTWMTQLTVAVPIFDRSITKSRLMSAKAVLEQDKIALEQKELDIKSDVETAWTSIETSSFSLKASKKAVELAKESLRLAQVGYEEGVTPQIDLLTAQTALTSTQLDHASSQYNHLMTIVALKVTEGTIVKWSREKNFQ